MSLLWRGVFILGLATALAGQESSVVPREPQTATGVRALDRNPTQPTAEVSPRAEPFSAPAQVPVGNRLQRSGLQPVAGAPALIGGEWVSPQLILGGSEDLPRVARQMAQVPRLAGEKFQPSNNARALQTASGLNKKFEGKLVKRYAEATVVRFLAPRESLENLFDQVGLDELNRYQFRRNRSDTVPVERVAE